MINSQLINPKSIVVIGGSNNTIKPGGKVIKNILSGNFSGNIYSVNPKESEVQGIKNYKSVNDIPETDLAINAISANQSNNAIKTLTE